MSGRFDKALSIGMVVLPPLVFLAKIVFGGGGWITAMMFVVVGPAWLVWYLALVVVSRVLRAQEGAFALDDGLGNRLIRGSIVAQLGFFNLLCLLLPDFTDVGGAPSALGSLLGLSGEEETRLLVPVTGPIAVASAPGVLAAFVLMIAMVLTIWSRRAKRGSITRTPGA